MSFMTGTSRRTDRCRTWRYILLLSAVLPTVLVAQQDPRGTQRGRETRLTLGWSGNAPVEFNPQRCGSSVGMSFGFGMAREILPHVWIGARGDMMYANPIARENCFFGTDETPIPESGPFITTREEVTNRVPQYQFASVAALAALEPISLNLFRARLFGGLGAIAFKPVFPRFYGIELLPGSGQSRFALSVERWDVTLRYDSVTYNYLNGVLRDRTTRAFTKDRSTVVVRLSMVNGFGGRGPR